MSSFDAPFETPAGLPQLEHESNAPIQELLETAPKFDPAFGPELLVLMRNHIVLRSAFMFCMEVARESELKLRHENDPNEVFRAQGEIRGLARYADAVQTLLITAEEARGNEDAPE